MENKQTAVELLFEEFKALSKVARDAGDEKSANLIDFLCEREQVAKEMEKEQLGETWDAALGAFDARGFNRVRAIVDFDDYYNETYGK